MWSGCGVKLILSEASHFKNYLVKLPLLTDFVIHIKEGSGSEVSHHPFESQHSDGIPFGTGLIILGLFQQLDCKLIRHLCDVAFPSGPSNDDIHCLGIPIVITNGNR